MKRSIQPQPIPHDHFADFLYDLGVRMAKIYREERFDPDSPISGFDIEELEEEEEEIN